MNKKTTEELMGILNNAHTKKDLQTYAADLETVASFEDFADYFSHLIEKKHLSSADVISLSQIQRNYGYQILSGTKHPSRDKVIALCLSAELSSDETRRALTLAGHNVLYPKVRRDSILIFALENQLSVLDTNELLEEMNEEILK